MRPLQTLAQCLDLRDVWQERFAHRPSPAVVPEGPSSRRGPTGGLYGAEGTPEPLFRPEKPPLLISPIPSVRKFLSSLKEIMTAVQNPACKSFCYRRLRYLEEKFTLHTMFNSSAELQETRDNHHRDFYNVRKVDTHVHHAACMNQKQLLNFIRRKYDEEGDTIVHVLPTGGAAQTLKDVFSSMGLDAYAASVDCLGVHALGSCFQRFDLFNQKYNPFGQRTLRDVFLKTDNHLRGRFLAELTREVIKDLEDRRYQHMEWRISIYGSHTEEWSRLAAWVVDNKLTSVRVRWLIQVPRLYYVYRTRGGVRSFGHLLENVFGPLFEAASNPEKHPKIFTFLQQVVGWDSVDDESHVSKYTMEGGDLPPPELWTSSDNPPYSYWGYYMYANIRALNRLLYIQGVRPLAFRPHCGEAGSVSHLATMFLLAKGINHGILLKKSPVLQYLFYLQQIGIAMSPLSNNALFLEVAKNPLNLFFKIGLNVSLSTDDPLMFHFTDEPLLEEYSLAAHHWKLTPVDLCELARNSVLQSGYEDEYKAHWLGPQFRLPGKRGNCMRQSNVSDIRLQYREDTLRDELCYMHDVLALRLAFPEGATLAEAAVAASSSNAVSANLAATGDGDGTTTQLKTLFPGALVKSSHAGFQKRRASGTGRQDCRYPVNIHVNIHAPAAAAASQTPADSQKLTARALLSSWGTTATAIGPHPKCVEAAATTLS
ncbi:AMP deaminase 2-like [Cyclospora cayetanensis]|uniref:AMP deaminase n=1 Tax=Cyclospora cayetanensis TaxID=88456 RepID=A0A6P6RWJ1_9EIME|nr:AMP deaminase 2-like [Cyclospora cayetanensis]